MQDHQALRSRYDAVATLIGQASSSYPNVAEALRTVGDLETILARVPLRSARPRDLTQLRDALGIPPQLLPLLRKLNSPLLRELITSLNDHADEHALLTKAVVESPPHHLRDGGRPSAHQPEQRRSHCFASHRVAISPEVPQLG
jgi:DNA mismatch repair protein MutS